MARVDEESIIKAALASQTEETDAFFLSCKALQAVDVVREIETRTGLPVVTSNQACAWALARHAQITVDAKRWGRLFTQQQPWDGRMSFCNPITVQQIRTAAKRIAPVIRTTPLVKSEGLSWSEKAPVFLKLEHHQITNSFTFRDASNAIMSLSEKAKARGVVGVSTGNHERVLAYAAQENGVPCIICMSRLVPQNKIDGIKALGSEVRIIGASQDDAQVEVDLLVHEEGMTMIPPFDHLDIVAGQGSLGLEMFEALPEMVQVLVPVSGGDLISGVASALKAMNKKIKIIGVSMERGAAMYACLHAGKPILVRVQATLADSLGGGIGLDNQVTFNVTKNLIDDFVLVNEAEIANGIRHAYWQERQIIEGSGAVCIAALMAQKVEPKGPTIACITGGNIDLALHHRIISGENVEAANL